MTQLSNIIITEPVPFSITNIIPVDDDCIGGNGQITFDLNLNAGPVDYIVRDQINPGNPPITGSSATSGPLDVIIIAGLNAGTYSLEVTDAAGGCTDSQAPIVVDPTLVTDLQVAPTIAECGTTLDFTPYATSATAGASFEWSLNSGGPYNNIATAYTDLGNQTVFIKAASIATCDSIMGVDVTLVPTPTVIINRDDSELCNGMVTLTANADGGYPGSDVDLSYRWSSGETTPSIVVTQTSTPSVSVSNLLNLSCFATEMETVNIPTPFGVTLSSTLACDDGRPFTLTATPTGQVAPNPSYSWTLNGTDLPDITSQILSVNAGTFEVTVTDPTSNCSNSASLEIIKAPVTPTTLSSAQVFCPDEGGVILDAGPNFISYQWDSGETTQTITVAQEGVYKVNATNNFNCVTSDQSQVLEDCIPKVYGPTAFRPGGLNNEFFLFTEYIEDFEIFIYNRWGNLIYQSNEIDFRWDGTFDGQLLPAAQYSWIARYTSSFRDRGTLEQYGGVVLLR